MRFLKVSERLVRVIESGETLIVLRPDDLLERITPGEWFVVDSIKKYLCYGNPNAQPGQVLRVCTELHAEVDQTTIVEQLLWSALNFRKRIWGRYSGARLVHGAGDKLPGLIIDAYEEQVLVETNTMGMWNQRGTIAMVLNQALPNHGVLWINSKGHLEELPQGENTHSCHEILIREGDLTLRIPWSKMQKLGYYFDHRRNRERLRRTIHQLRDLQTGLDLFCYNGSWGMSMLKAGLEHVTFVDQGDFSDLLESHLEENGLSGKGVFHRGDAFEFLDQKMRSREMHDVIVSDPPAFTKKPDQKKQALRGYKKLHEKCLQILRQGGVFVAASCTSYINLEELDDTVQTAARNKGRQLRLIDLGLQGEDHSFAGLKSKENYIKYLCYIVD